MILWRPSQNNQRYAFTPLLDNSENDDTDDELFNSSQAGVYEMLKQRTQPPTEESLKIEKQNFSAVNVIFYILGLFKNCLIHNNYIILFTL